MASRNNCLDTFYNGWEVFKPVRAHGRLKLTMEMKDRYFLIEQSLCSDWHGASNNINGLFAVFRLVRLGISL